MPCPFLIFSQSDYKFTYIVLNCKQCRSRSVGIFRSQLIWICTVCKGSIHLGLAGQGFKAMSQNSFSLLKCSLNLPSKTQSLYLILQYRTILHLSFGNLFYAPIYICTLRSSYKSIRSQNLCLFWCSFLDNIYLMSPVAVVIMQPLLHFCLALKQRLCYLLNNCVVSNEKCIDYVEKWPFMVHFSI